MADSILKIRTQDGDKPIGYPGLADKPVANKTLDTEGAFADAKVVGDKFKEVKAETASLKEDLGRIDFEDILITKDSSGSNIVKAVLHSGQKYIVENDTNTATNVQIRKNNSSEVISNLGNIRPHEKIEFVSNVSGSVDFYTFSSDATRIILSSTDTIIDELENEITSIKKRRKFKPKYYVSRILGYDWTPTQMSDWLAHIEKWYSLGIDGMCLCLDYEFSNGEFKPVTYQKKSETYTFKDMLEETLVYISKYKKGVTLKLHCLSDFSGQTNEYLAKYFEEVKSLDVNYGKYFDTFVLFNESDIVVTAPSACINIFNYCKNINKNVSTSLMCDSQYRSKVSDTIYNACSFIGINTYPCVGYKDEATTIDDVKNAIQLWKDKLLSLAVNHKSKDVIVTECGIFDRWVFFRSPSTWQLGNLDNTPTDGRAAVIYMTAILDMLNDINMTIYDFYNMTDFALYNKFLAELLGGEVNV